MAEEQHEENAQHPPGPPFEFAAGWPEKVGAQVARVFAFDLDQIQGKQRLGDLSFDNPPDRVRSIREVLRDLAMEPWDELPDGVRNGLPPQLQGVIEIVDAMIALSPTDTNVHAEKESLESRIDDAFRWFREQWPHARRAFIDRRLDERESELPTGEAVSEARAQLQQLQKLAEKLNHEIDARRDVVSAFRQASGESAGEDLTVVFTERAKALGETAKNWFIALGATTLVALAGATLTFLALRPDRGDQDPADFAALGLAVFILGLLAFAVRVCAQNYRVNRHLEAVANSKAAALGTFTRLIASIEQEDIRSAVTLTLAQAVFTTEDTGLVDSSGDHVTLIERAVAPRLSGSSTTGVHA